MFLFKVDNNFMVTGVGLVLTPGLGDKKANTGDKIKIIRPDGSVISAVIRGIAFDKSYSIAVGKDLSKEDVPIGSEVWLDE